MGLTKCRPSVCLFLFVSAYLGLLIAAVATVVTPFTTSVGMLAGVLAVSGIAEGIINTGKNYCVIAVIRE